MTDELKKAREVFEHSCGDIEINLGKIRTDLIINEVAEALRRQSIESRNDALEEAAKIGENFEIQDEVSSRIRALKKAL